MFMETKLWKYQYLFKDYQPHLTAA